MYFKSEFLPVHLLDSYILLFAMNARDARCRALAHTAAEHGPLELEKFHKIPPEFDDRWRNFQGRISTRPVLSPLGFRTAHILRPMRTRTNRPTIQQNRPKSQKYCTAFCVDHFLVRTRHLSPGKPRANYPILSATEPLLSPSTFRSRWVT